MTKKQLNLDQMVQLLVKLKGGATISELAREFNVHRVTIRRRLTAYRGSKKLVRIKHVRRCKVSRLELRRFEKLLDDDPFACYGELLSKLNYPVHRTTLGRYARRLGLKKFIAARKPDLTEEHKEERLSRATQRVNWTIFTDESHCDNSGLQRRYVVRPRGARFRNRFIAVIKNKSLVCHYFGWVSYEGCGGLVFYKRMNTKMYCRLMQELIEHLKDNFIHKDF